MRVRVTDIVLIVACVASIVIYGIRPPEPSPKASTDRAGAEPPEESLQIVPTPYAVIEETDLSDESRTRVVVDIEAPEAAGAGERAQIETMMAAAVDRHRLDRPDVVGVRLWASHKTDMHPVNGIAYSGDGCGWAGSDCTGIVWGTAVRGAVPRELRRWGDPVPTAPK